MYTASQDVPRQLGKLSLSKEDNVRTIRHVATIAALLLSGSGLAAQQPAMPGHSGMSDRMQQEMKGMMDEMQGMMHDMMGVHAYAPDMLLDRKAELALKADQVGKLQDLAAEVKTAKEHAKAEHDVRHARIIEQFKLAKPDPSKVKADGQEAMTDMAAAHGIELSAFARAKGLLTDDQRAKVDSWIAEHGKMMKGPGDSAHAGHH
jgi:hypothetical protein